jgi:hypothetical protein
MTPIAHASHRRARTSQQLLLHSRRRFGRCRPREASRRSVAPAGQADHQDARLARGRTESLPHGSSAACGAMYPNRLQTMQLCRTRSSSRRVSGVSAPSRRPVAAEPRNQNLGSHVVAMVQERRDAFQWVWLTREKRFGNHRFHHSGAARRRDCEGVVAR